MLNKPISTNNVIKQPDGIYVVGAGGHGKVAVRAAQESGIKVLAIFDDDPSKKGHHLFGVPIVGGLALFQNQAPMPTLIAIGDNRQRLSLAMNTKHPAATVIHPTAIIDSEAHVGAGVLILAGSIVQVDSIIGDYAIINDRAIVEHDCYVAEGAHISCGACLTGSTRVGRGTLVGANAVLLPQIEVGDFVKIGAGAVVINDIPSHVTAVGVPARVLPDLCPSKAA